MSDQELESFKTSDLALSLSLDQLSELNRTQKGAGKQPKKPTKSNGVGTKERKNGRDVGKKTGRIEKKKKTDFQVSVNKTGKRNVNATTSTTSHNKKIADLDQIQVNVSFGKDGVKRRTNTVTSAQAKRSKAPSSTSIASRSRNVIKRNNGNQKLDADKIKVVITNDRISNKTAKKQGDGKEVKQQNMEPDNKKKKKKITVKKNTGKLKRVHEESISNDSNSLSATVLKQQESHQNNEGKTVLVVTPEEKEKLLSLLSEGERRESRNRSYSRSPSRRRYRSRSRSHSRSRSRSPSPRRHRKYRSPPRRRRRSHD